MLTTAEINQLAALCAKIKDVGVMQLSLPDGVYDITIQKELSIPSVEVALDLLSKATSIEQMKAITDRVDDLYHQGVLQVSEEQWRAVTNTIVRSSDRIRGITTESIVVGSK